MNARENKLRAIRFGSPAYIPMTFSINPACWNHYPRNLLLDLIGQHPLLFPDPAQWLEYRPHFGPKARKDSPYTDPWGCIWQTSMDGINGSVIKHPLADWNAFEDFIAPDPDETDGVAAIDWHGVAGDITVKKRRGDFISGRLPHGHTFLRLQNLRGYENLILDMHDEEPKLKELIGIVAGFNSRIVHRWLEMGVDMMCYPEDLGMQVGPMLSPGLFRKHIQPVYTRLMEPARQRGVIVHMHSDGDIRMLADDLTESGVDVINLQDLVNGIDWIAERFAGRVCVEMDIDRQQITPYGAPDQIDALVREEVEKIGSRKGGLMMIYGLYPGVPAENVKAVMDAMERYSAYY